MRAPPVGCVDEVGLMSKGALLANEVRPSLAQCCGFHGHFSDQSFTTTASHDTKVEQGADSEWTDVMCIL